MEEGVQFVYGSTLLLCAVLMDATVEIGEMQRNMRTSRLELKTSDSDIMLSYYTLTSYTHQLKLM